MSVGVYKPGQGYWVRALSAVFFGVIVLAAAAWGWQQAEAVDLPVSAYSITVRSVRGDINTGEQLQLIAISSDVDARRVPIGTGVVEEVSRLADGRVRLRVGTVEVTEADYVATDAVALLKGSERAPEFAGTIPPGGRTAITVFPLIYLQAGVAGGLILIGAVLLYWYVAVHRKSVDFLVATDGEMKKVNWSSKREIIGSTQVVIVAAFLIAAILFVIDTMFSRFFHLIGVLEV